MKQWLKKLENILVTIAGHHVGAYAAQSAFFLMLSLVPIFMLLMTLVRVTPITQADIIEVAYEVFPKTVSGAIISVIDEVYSQTGTTITISLLVAFWSAGRGVLAISNGLTTIRGTVETLIAIVLCLVLLGFGNSISLLVNEYIPVIQYVIDFIIEIRTIVTISILIVITTLMYEFLPNKRGKPLRQLPGAIFTAFGLGVLMRCTSIPVHSTLMARPCWCTILLVMST